MSYREFSGDSSRSSMRPLVPARLAAAPRVSAPWLSPSSRCWRTCSGSRRWLSLVPGGERQRAGWEVGFGGALACLLVCLLVCCLYCHTARPAHATRVIAHIPHCAAAPEKPTTRRPGVSARSQDVATRRPGNWRVSRGNTQVLRGWGGHVGRVGHGERVKAGVRWSWRVSRTQAGAASEAEGGDGWVGREGAHERKQARAGAAHAGGRHPPQPPRPPLHAAPAAHLSQKSTAAWLCEKRRCSASSWAALEASSRRTSPTGSSTSV